MINFSQYTLGIVKLEPTYNRDDKECGMIFDVPQGSLTLLLWYRN